MKSKESTADPRPRRFMCSEEQLSTGKPTENRGKKRKNHDVHGGNEEETQQYTPKRGNDTRLGR